MVDFSLRQLRYFHAVAEAGSIAAAAARLHVTATAVAASVSELERILGVQLLVRRRAHGASLTPSGSYLATRAASLLREADELSLSVAGRGTELSGPLTLGCYVTLSPTVLPLAHDWFARRHPRVDLRFVVGDQADLPAQVLAGALDLAIVFEVPQSEQLDSRELFAIRPYALLPAEHPAAAAPSVSLRELADEPLILLDVPPAAGHTLSLFAREGLTPRIGQRTSDFELTRSLVARGAGYSLLVQRPASDMSYEGLPLAAVPLDPDPEPLGIWMVWATEMRPTDRARAFAAFATAHAHTTDPHGRAVAAGASRI